MPIVVVSAKGAHRVGGRCLRPPDAGLAVARRVWFGWSWPVRAPEDVRQAEDD